MTEFYLLRDPILPWGDYGHILHHGMSNHLRRDREQCIQLERTGPYVPPIAFPGYERNIIITDSFRALLERGPFDGLVFRQVRKACIVHLEWERWDRSAPRPAVYPRGGAPECYILGQRHDPGLAAAIGDLWELLLPTGGESESVETEDPLRPVRLLNPSTWTGVHLFKTRPTVYYCSHAGKAWLEKYASGLMGFEPAMIKDGRDVE